MEKNRLLAELRSYPVFDLAALKHMTGKGQDYSKLVSYRLRKEGSIIGVERDKYTVHRNPFLVASYLTWPSYISGWSAARHHNLTEQIVTSITVITLRKRSRKRINFLGTPIEFVNTNEKYFFGYGRTDVDGFPVFIAEPEKSLIDGLLFRKISVPEVFEMIKKNKGKLNYNKLVWLTSRIGSRSLAKRVGFLLEKLGIGCKGLEKYISLPYIPLESGAGGEYGKNEKWKIIENVVL